MASMDYQRTAGLAALRRAFETSTKTGMEMAPSSVGQMVLTIGVLETRARDMENEISRHRWNELARAERIAR